LTRPPALSLLLLPLHSFGDIAPALRGGAMSV
jgi:hypothetical protein